ncbi:ArsR/SmtB family transcription factor [Paraburkholderia sp. EG286B]|uniref:ArsR/SmtB family transcription factor n=1 Tax=Paraburkholderia sp. EG286B TaxID=3237011 RepID=UPI0034D20642
MEADHLSATFAALADPTRRAILARLAQGEATVGDLAGPFDMSAPAISKHLRVLARAGLITQGRDRQFRPCRIAPEPLKQAADWALQYRALWEQRLDQLDSYLQQLQQKPARDSHGKPAPKTTSNVTPTRTRKTRRHD